MTARGDDRIEDWPDRLEAAIATTSFRGVTVLATTGSTQDAARRRGPRIGDVIVAGRQTAGRGRHGRSWQDTGDDGVAVSVVVPAAPPARLSIASAVAVAQAIEPLLERTVGIKWPNDVIVDGRKLCGILIEQAPEAAIVGIGVNVHQTTWSAELSDHAVSLRQLGARVERVVVLESVLRHLDAIAGWDDEAIVAAFRTRDALSGTDVTLCCNGVSMTGRVRAVDPMAALTVEVEGEVRRLPVAGTTILRWRDTASWRS